MGKKYILCLAVFMIFAMGMTACKKDEEEMVNVITTVIDTTGDDANIVGAVYKLGETYEYVSSKIINDADEYETQEKEKIDVDYGTAYPDVTGTSKVTYYFTEGILTGINLNVLSDAKEDMENYLKDTRHYCVGCGFEKVDGEGETTYYDVNGNYVRISDITISYQDNLYTYDIGIYAAGQ